MQSIPDVAALYWRFLRPMREVPVDVRMDFCTTVQHGSAGHGYVTSMVAENSSGTACECRCYIGGPPASLIRHILHRRIDVSRMHWYQPLLYVRTTCRKLPSYRSDPYLGPNPTKPLSIRWMGELQWIVTTGRKSFTLPFAVCPPFWGIQGDQLSPNIRCWSHKAAWIGIWER